MYGIQQYDVQRNGSSSEHLTIPHCDHHTPTSQGKSIIVNVRAMEQMIAATWGGRPVSTNARRVCHGKQDRGRKGLEVPDAVYTIITFFSKLRYFEVK